MVETPRQLKVSVIRGDAEPAVLRLDGERIVTFGRGRSCNVRVTDPLVDFQHARFYWSPDLASYVVEDLGSAYGTFADGQQLRGGIQRVTAGSKLRLGDTEFEIHSPGRLTARTRVIVLSITLVLAIIGVLSQWIRFPVDKSDPKVWLGPTRVTAPQAFLGERALVIPPAFLWENGISSQLELLDIARHEWFEWDVLILRDTGRSRLVVLTFDDGAIQLLGDLPNGEIRRVTGGLPEVLADGFTWRLEPRTRRYEAVDQESPVVWYRERPPKNPDEPRGLEVLGPLQVGRFAFKGDSSQMAVFLSERGINDPVHWLVCEGAFDGVGFQALDDEGQAQKLGKACYGRLALVGGKKDLEAVAVALSPSGYFHLLDAVTTFYSGDATGLFLSERDAAEIVDPARRQLGSFVGDTRLSPKSDDPRLPLFSPYPTRPVPTNADGLIEDDDPQAALAARHVVVERLPYPGFAGTSTTVSTPACELRVEVGSQQRVRRPFELWPAAFVRVWCGEQPVVRAPYAPGTYRGRGPDGLEVAVRVEMDGDRVRRAVLGWRR